MIEDFGYSISNQRISSKFQTLNSETIVKASIFERPLDSSKESFSNDYIFE